MITPAWFREMAEYNKWQNGNVLPLLDAMSEQERNKDRGLFFNSLHRTFDHIAMCDTWFLDTLQDRPPVPFTPDRVLHADWPSLKEARHRLDREIIALANAITEAWCDSIIEAHSVTLNRLRRIPRGLWVTQMFNHQTHHRSQLTTGLHMMGLKYGTTDLPFRPGSGF
jgi:uncharacterized damage-inducible protein DinB